MGVQARVTPQATISIIRKLPGIQNPTAGPILSHVPVLLMGIQARVTLQATLSITRIPPVIQNPAAGPILSYVPVLPMGIQARVTLQATLSITRIPPVIQNPAAGPILAHHVPWTPVHLWLTLTASPEILWIPLTCSRLQDRKPTTSMQLCLLPHRRVTTRTNLGICCKIWHHRTLPGIGICRLRNHWYKWNLAHTGCSRLSHWCHDIRCTTVWPKPTTCTSKLKVIRTSRRCAPKPKWTTLRGIGRMQTGVS